LNGIIGFAGLLKGMDRLDTQEASDGLDIIQQSGNLLLAVVNDVLDFSRLETHSFALVVRVVDVRSIISAVGANLRIRAEKRGVGFHMSIDESTVPTLLEMDNIRLSQILFNVGSNAVRVYRAVRLVTHSLPHSLTPLQTVEIHSQWRSRDDRGVSGVP
jgi:signal transduction histidine kinase